MLLVLTNTTPESAPTLARALVEEGIAACVTETPVTSTYMWKGEIQRDGEMTLTAKVPKENIHMARERILALHPYELPEILVLPIEEEASYTPYVEWVRTTAIPKQTRS